MFACRLSGLPPRCCCCCCCLSSLAFGVRSPSTGRLLLSGRGRAIAFPGGPMFSLWPWNNRRDEGVVDMMDRKEQPAECEDQRRNVARHSEVRFHRYRRPSIASQTSVRGGCPFLCNDVHNLRFPTNISTTINTRPNHFSLSCRLLTRVRFSCAKIPLWAAG